MIMTGAVAIATSHAMAGLVMYDDNTNTGDDEVLYEILVSDDRPGVFDFEVSFADDSPMTGDIVALYFDFDLDGANEGYSPSDFQGDAITDVDFDTKNVQNGNIGQRFQFGLAIGTPGAGRDFYDAFSFSMNIRNDLLLGDLDMFGVRSTGVGLGASEDEPGNGSGKTFVEQGVFSGATQIPMPTSAGLAVGGIALICAYRRQRVC
jgi:hypothetical protein